MTQMREYPNASISIGPLRRVDEAALIDLWVASWREAMPTIDFDSRRDFIAQALRDDDLQAFVARTGDRPVGFALLEAGYLHQLVVAPAAKGRGIAKELLDAIKAEVRECLTLEVNQDNARAVRFYEREGFVRQRAGLNRTSGLKTWTLCWTC